MKTKIIACSIVAFGVFCCASFARTADIPTKEQIAVALNKPAKPEWFPKKTDQTGGITFFKVQF